MVRLWFGSSSMRSNHIPNADDSCNTRKSTIHLRVLPAVGQPPMPANERSFSHQAREL